jgi:hypothetical protein
MIYRLSPREEVDAVDDWFGETLRDISMSWSTKPGSNASDRLRGDDSFASSSRLVEARGSRAAVGAITHSSVVRRAGFVVDPDDGLEASFRIIADRERHFSVLRRMATSDAEIVVCRSVE